MSKLQLNLSSKRKYVIDLPGLRIMPLYILDYLSVFSFIVFLPTILYLGVSVDYLPVHILKALIFLVIFLLASQAMKAILGGGQFFPASKFDLVSLFVAVTLISILLFKQIFELQGGEGMLPEENSWQYAILGILLLLGFGYLLDINLRKAGAWKVAFTSFIMLSTAFSYLYFLIEGVETSGNNIEFFVILALLLPLFKYASIGDKGMYYRIVGVLNVLILFAIVSYSLPSDVFFILGLGLLISGISLALVKGMNFTPFKDFVEFFVKFLNRKKVNYASYKGSIMIVSMVMLGVVVVLGSLIAGVLKDEVIPLVRMGVDRNFEIVTQKRAFEEYFIGGNFEDGNGTLIANMFESYGLLGLGILGLFDGLVLFVAFMNARRAYSMTRPSNIGIDFGLFVSILSIILFVAFLYMDTLIGSVFLMLVAFLGSRVMIKAKEVPKYQLISVKRIKDRRALRAFRIMQLAAVASVVFLAVYLMIYTENTLV